MIPALMAASISPRVFLETSRMATFSRSRCWSGACRASIITKQKKQFQGVTRGKSDLIAAPGLGRGSDWGRVFEPTLLGATTIPPRRLRAKPALALASTPIVVVHPGAILIRVEETRLLFLFAGAAMGRVREHIRVNGKQCWTLFDTGARNTYVVPAVAALVTTTKLLKPFRSAVPDEERLDLTHYPKEFVEF
jgi:hypothetical protein